MLYFNTNVGATLSTKPNLLQSMCSVCCTTSWICAATPITECRSFATLSVSAKISP